MNQINELIAEYCPEGVGFVQLGELLNYQQSGKYLVKSTAYDDAFSTPVLTAGQTFVLGYTDETEGIYTASYESPVIIFDDFTTAFKWVDFSFKAKSSAMKILTPNPGVNLRYVWFAMQTIPYAPQDHARQWIGTYSKFRIPVPPLEVQRAIVEILDKFTALEAALEAELEARKKQYEHYRFSILKSNDPISWKSVEELCEVSRGRVMSKDYLAANTGPYPVYSSQTANQGIFGFINSYDHQCESVTWTTDGANAGSVFYHDPSEKFSITNVCGLLKVKDSEVISAKYLFHCLSILTKSYVSTGMGNPKLMSTAMKRVQIPIQPLHVQNEIVDILDKFDALVNDLSSGLPAEIAARRKQYEYYRDQLLTFKELAS